MPTRYKSNRKNVETELERVIRRTVEGEADDYLRIVQDEYRKPKHGRLYGVDTAVSFTAKDGRAVNFTANRGKLAALRQFRAGRRKTRPSRVHRASAPNEAPAIETAALSKGSQRTAALKIARLRWAVGVGVTVQSGRGSRSGADSRSTAERLEFGTTKMRPRPVWVPALSIFRARRRNLKGG